MRKVPGQALQPLELHADQGPHVTADYDGQEGVHRGQQHGVRCLATQCREEEPITQPSKTLKFTNFVS